MESIGSTVSHSITHRITGNGCPSSRKVLAGEMFEGRKVGDRIVSIDRRMYVLSRKGKETKSVEFGAKGTICR